MFCSGFHTGEGMRNVKKRKCWESSFIKINNEGTGSIYFCFLKVFDVLRVNADYNAWCIEGEVKDYEYLNAVGFPSA